MHSLGRRLYVLEYHSVTENPDEPEGEVHSARFARHIAWLNQRFDLVTLGDGFERLERGEEGRDLLAVTFDDGYLNNVEIAWPILCAHGVPGTFFLTSGFLDGAALWFEVALRALAEARTEVGQGRDASAYDELFGRGWVARGDHQIVEQLKQLPGEEFDQVVARLMAMREDEGWQTAPSARAMSWDDARSLAEQGAELGAHTVNHPILSMLTEARQRSEISDSKKRIESELGRPCEVFAYPNGSRRDFDDCTIDLARSAGFKAACTTIRGSNVRGQEPMALRRIGVGPDPTYLLDARLAGLFDDAVRKRLGGQNR